MAKNEQIELFHIVVSGRELTALFAGLVLLQEQRTATRVPFTSAEINRLSDQLSSWRATVLNSFTVQLSRVEHGG